MPITKVITDVNSDIRANVAYPALGQKVTKKTFDGSADGTQGAKNIFLVTGDVLVRIIAKCTTNLAGATATVELGVAGDTAGIIAQTTGTDVDADEIWHDTTPDTDLEEESAAVKSFVIIGGADIILTIGTADLTAGVLEFYCFFEPISENGNVVAA